MEGTLVKEWEGAPGSPAGSRVSTNPKSGSSIWVDEERFRQLLSEGVVAEPAPWPSAPSPEVAPLLPLPTLPPLEEPEP